MTDYPILKLYHEMNIDIPKLLRLGAEKAEPDEDGEWGMTQLYAAQLIEKHEQVIEAMTKKIMEQARMIDMLLSATEGRCYCCVNAHSNKKKSYIMKCKMHPKMTLYDTGAKNECIHGYSMLSILRE